VPLLNVGVAVLFAVVAAPTVFCALHAFRAVPFCQNTGSVARGDVELGCGFDHCNFATAPHPAPISWHTGRPLSEASMPPKRPPPIAVPEPAGGLPMAGASPTMLTSSAAAAVMASKSTPKTKHSPNQHHVTVKSPPPGETAKYDSTAPSQPTSGPQSLSIPDRKRVLWIMCLLKVITSYDSGAYGAVLGIDDGIA